jgi:hypothetical protein
VFSNRGIAAMYQEKYTSARQLLEESLVIASKTTITRRLATLRSSGSQPGICSAWPGVCRASIAHN